MTNRYKLSIEAALKTVLNDMVADDKAVAQSAGRPSTKRIVNGNMLGREEYDVYLALIEFWKQARELGRGEIMSDEQFVVFMKAAAPKLNKRMIDMALVSDDLKAVRQVAADLADRGYGRAASQININVGVKDIRSAWKQLSDNSVIDVTNLIEGEAKRVDVEDVI